MDGNDSNMESLLPLGRPLILPIQPSLSLLFLDLALSFLNIFSIVIIDGLKTSPPLDEIFDGSIFSDGMHAICQMPAVNIQVSTLVE